MSDNEAARLAALSAWAAASKRVDTLARDLEKARGDEQSARGEALRLAQAVAK